MSKTMLTRRTVRNAALWSLLFACVQALIGCAHTKPPPQNESLKRAIRSYMGAPYCYGGESRKGVDCSGLVRAVYRTVGVNLPHNVEKQYELGESVKKKNLIYGDVVFFNTKPWSGASPCVSPCILLGFSVPMVYGETHNGIYTGDGTFVHASSSRGVVTDRLDDEYWRKRYIGARRYLE